MKRPVSGRQQVSQYIAKAHPRARPMLRQLRRIVTTCAPEAIEKLSYRVPYYGYHGRLTYFAAFSKHVSLYVMGRSKLRFAKAMKPWQSSPSTLRFPFGATIPATLVERLIRARMRENELARKRR